MTFTTFLIYYIISRLIFIFGILKSIKYTDFRPESATDQLDLTLRIFITLIPMGGELHILGLLIFILVKLYGHKLI